MDPTAEPVAESTRDTPAAGPDGDSSEEHFSDSCQTVPFFGTT